MVDAVANGRWTEDIELTLSHVGVGTLGERSALNLFAVALSHAISLETGISPNVIRDARGNLLYPAYFWTHLQVPAECPLDTFGLWDTVTVSVQLGIFGGMMLESTSVLDRGGVSPSQGEGGKVVQSPSLRAGSLFIVEESRRGTVRPAIPAVGQIASLPKLRAKPESAIEFDRIRKAGVAGLGGESTIAVDGLLYPIVPGRDVDRDHALMFSTFCWILDHAEQIALRSADGGIPPGQLVERKIYYFSDTYEGDTLVTSFRASKWNRHVEDAPDAPSRKSSDLAMSHEVRSEVTGRLLAIAWGRKRLGVDEHELQDRLEALNRQVILQLVKKAGRGAAKLLLLASPGRFEPNS